MNINKEALSRKTPCNIESGEEPSFVWGCVLLHAIICIIYGVLNDRESKLFMPIGAMRSEKERADEQYPSATDRV